MVRAKFRFGMLWNDIVPPRQMFTILKNGILFDEPIKKSRLLRWADFKIINTSEAITNIEAMHVHMMYLKGKNSFSNDEYALPVGIAYKSDP